MEENKKAGAAKVPASALEDQLGKIADIMLGKMNPGIVGGTPHVPLTPEQLAKLPKKTMKDVAKEYLADKDSTNFPWPGIHVSSDLQVFIGNTLGENALANHKAANPAMTSEAFQTPGFVATTEE